MKAFRRRSLGMVAVGVIVVASCGGSDAEVEAFCDDYVAAVSAFSGDGADPATMESLVAAVETSAPDDIGDAVGTVTSAARTVLEGGDFSVMETEEFETADAAINSYMKDECGYGSVSVTAVDYAFRDVPATLKAETVAIDFTNAGTEAHELAVLRIDDGVTQSLQEILALGEEESAQLVSFVGGTFAMPGDDATTFVALTAGRYAFICFVPVGATPENIPGLESGEFEGGPPHFTQGMVAEFTVEA